MQAIEEELRAFQIAECGWRERDHAGARKCGAQEDRRRGALRLGQGSARQLQQDHARGRVPVEVENPGQPAQPVARGLAGVRRPVRHHGGLNGGAGSGIDTGWKGEDAAIPIGAQPAQVAIDAGEGIHVRQSMFAPLSGALEAGRPGGQQVANVAPQRDSLEQASHQGMRAVLARSHGRGELPAIREAQPGDDEVQVDDAVGIHIFVILIRILVERQNDRRESSMVRVGVAQHVIPVARQGSGDAEVPEVQFVSGGGRRGRGREPVRDARIAQHHNLGSGTVRAFARATRGSFRPDRRRSWAPANGCTTRCGRAALPPGGMPREWPGSRPQPGEGGHGGEPSSDHFITNRRAD